MKFVVLIGILALTNSALARGVLVKCHEYGAVKHTLKSSVIYKNNGGYLFEDFAVVSGEKESIVASDDNCIHWGFPEVCKETSLLENGDTVVLTLENSYQDFGGTDHLRGTMFTPNQGQKIKVSCTREAI